MAECVLLLLLSTLVALVQGTSAERDYSDISTSSSVGRSLHVKGPQGGRTFLLPVLVPARKDLPWGKGIRFGSRSGRRCDSAGTQPSAAALLLKRTLEHVGPTRCISTPRNKDADREFKRGTIDILAESIWITNHSQVFLYAHEKDNVCVVVKWNEPVQQHILQSFCATTWAATGVCFALVIAALRLAGRRGVVLESLRTFVFGNFVETRRPLANYLYLLLCVFGLIMVTAFLAKFMSFLAVTTEASQPQTLEEANSRVSRLHDTTSFAEMMLLRDENEAMRELGTKVLPWSNLDEVMSDVASSSKAAVVIAQSTYEIYRRNPRWVDRDSRASLTYQVPQCILAPAYRAFNVRRSWTYKHRFDAILQWAIEAGLNLKARSDLWLLLQRAKWIVPEVPPSDEPEPLGLPAILQPMVVLGTGVALAAVVFVVECVNGIKLRRRHRRQRLWAHLVHRAVARR